jgi:hypothetical protein
VLAQERERSHISRELHDQLGQTLTAVVIHLHAAERAATRGARRHTTRRPNWPTARCSSSRRCRSRCGRRSWTCWAGPAVQSRDAAHRRAAGLRCEVSTRGRSRALEENASVAVRLVQEA